MQALHNQLSNGASLSKFQTSEYFHNVGLRALPGYYNAFESVGGVKGCVYSIDEEAFSKKIFVVFPGTQTLLEWAKNFFSITPSIVNNIQKSYHDDVNTLFAYDPGKGPFFEALHRQINAAESRYETLNSASRPENFGKYEYYFIGHSRGGGLSFLAARQFKEQFASIAVNAVTFCAPKIANAHVEQLKFVQTLGFDNIVHFARPYDVAPSFPFRFVENYGVRIPLRETLFLFLRRSHQVPDKEELDTALAQFNGAQPAGWSDPIRQLLKIEPKPILWWIGGVYFASYLPSHLTAGLLWLARNLS